MSAIVWGTFCNPPPQYGLSFYCEGSPACSIFENFPAVSCQNQTSKIYCTNGRTCGNANFTNDIYITFPLNSRTATSYDTVARATFAFNQTVSITSSTGKSSRELDPILAADNYARKRTTASSQSVYNQFKNIFLSSTNPAYSLVTALSKSLSSLGGGQSAATLAADIQYAVLAAVQTATPGIVSEIQACNPAAAVQSAITTVNQNAVSNITSSIVQSTFAEWMLTMSISHIIANIALVSDADVAQLIQNSNTGASCSTATSTSKTTTPVTSKTSKTSTSTKRSTSGSTKASTSTKSTRSSSATTAASSKISLAVSSISTSACPSATPTGQSVYKTNSTQNAALSGAFQIFNGSQASLQNILISPSSGSSALYSFPDADTFAVTLPDGESLIFSEGTSAITYIGASCGTAQSFLSNSPPASTKTKRYRQTKPDGDPQVEVDMYVYDQCGKPVTSGYQLQLDCANVVYSQESAASDPIVGTPTPVPFVGDGTGRYVASCDLAGLTSMNSAYNSCVTADRQSLDNFCGPELSNVNSAKSYMEDWIKDAKELGILVKYAKILGNILEKTEGSLSFWGKMCDSTWGLENPYVQAQMSAEDCGNPAALSMDVEGLDSNGNPFTSQLGTFAATPTVVSLQTTTSAQATVTPAYTDHLDTGSTSTGLGEAVYCCSGACIDGTRIGQTGQCYGWNDLCYDFSSPPQCGPNQWLGNGVDSGVDSGDGNCWGGDECQWTRNNWTWTCFDCPTGYQSTNAGSCFQPAQNYPGSCVGCSDPTYTLVGSSGDGYNCVKQCNNS